MKNLFLKLQKKILIIKSKFTSFSFKNFWHSSKNRLIKFFNFLKTKFLFIKSKILTFSFNKFWRNLRYKLKKIKNFNWELFFSKFNIFKKKKYNPNENIKISSFGKVAIIKFLTKFYFKSFYQPFFNFVLPIILFIIFNVVVKWQIAFPGILSMAIMIIGVNGVPFMIVELKQSVLLKRMGASPYRKSDFIISIIIFTSIQILVTVTWLLFFVYLYADFSSDIQSGAYVFLKMLFHDNGSFKTQFYFLIFIYGIFFNAFFSIIIGFVISIFSKNSSQAGAFSLLFIIPNLFLSGQFMSVVYIAQHPTLHYFSLFLPHRYITLLISTSFNAGGIFYSIPEGRTPFYFNLKTNILYRPESLDLQWLYETISSRSKGSNELNDLWSQLTGAEKKPRILGWLEFIFYLINPIGNKEDKIITIDNDKNVIFESFLKKLVDLNILEKNSDRKLWDWFQKGGITNIVEEFKKLESKEIIKFFRGLDGYKSWELILSHIYPIGIISSLIPFCYKKFQWSIR